MTTWTNNLEVPHLDQNVAQPEVPENVAKDIFDAIFAGKYTTDLPADADYTYIYVADPKLAQNWHNFVQEFTGALTTLRVITLPTNNRPYLLMNNTNQILEFKTTAQVAANVSVGIAQNAYVYSDGTDLFKLEFAPSSTNLVDLDDVSPYDDTKVLRSTAIGTEWYDIATDLATKLAHTGGTATTTTLAGTTTNSGTIDGGIASDLELKDYGLTEQTVTSGATPAFDLSNGNIISYVNTEIATITFTTTQTSTSFKLLITNATAFTLTWPTIKWVGGVMPTLTTTGIDLLEFTRIGGSWYGSVIELNMS